VTEIVEQVVARVHDEMETVHSRVASDIRDLQTLSEREILSIGNVLSTIVDSVESIVEDSREQLRRSTGTVEDITGQFLEHVEEESSAQQGAVDKVMSITDEMGRSIESIDYLRQSTEMLAINSLIEAARLGEQGKSFGVLAAQMRDLAKSVKETTAKVNEAIESVRRDLPMIAEHTSAMHGFMQRYIEDIKAQLERQQSLNEQGEGGNGLDGIIELTNKALSHLQFQDPLVQRLSAIEREVGRMTERIDAALRNEQYAEQDEDTYDSDSAASGAGAGNILMF
jgi:methyl-accepting chemotaxis protein